MKPVTSMQRLDGLRVVDHIPEGVSGRWGVQHFTVSRKEADAFNMRLSWRPATGDQLIGHGRYARLAVGRYAAPEPAPGLMDTTVVTSDTPFERRTNWQFVSEARGDVLIGGLGLGFTPLCLIPDPRVRSITIVEKERDVVDLVWKHVLKYRDKFGWWTPGLHRLHRPELTIVVDDVRTWRPPAGVKFDTIYFDIWAGVCQDNLEEIAKLHQAFKARKRPGGWMNSWIAETLRSDREEERRRGW